MENYTPINNLVYIGIGSNIGQRADNILTAIEKIDTDKNCTVEQVSSVYETKPFGVTEQGNFLNAVIKIKTMYSPAELFVCLKQIEKDLGRQTNVKWGPREIDLDILFYNNLIYTDENITIPHKGIAERDFVLVPLCEIDPASVHPVFGTAVSEINLPGSGSNIIHKITTELPDKWTKKNIIRKLSTSPLKV